MWGSAVCMCMRINFQCNLWEGFFLMGKKVKFFGFILIWFSLDHTKFQTRAGGIMDGKTTGWLPWTYFLSELSHMPTAWRGLKKHWIPFYNFTLLRLIENNVFLSACIIWKPANEFWIIIYKLIFWGDRKKIKWIA